MLGPGRIRRKRRTDRNNNTARPTQDAHCIDRSRTVSFNIDEDGDDFKDDGHAKHPPKQLHKRSSHLSDVATKEQYLDNDDALKNELVRLEAADSRWRNPISLNWISAARLYLGPFDPVYNNTSSWIQPEDLEDIPAMFDSFHNIMCLYYSLVGVLSIEVTLNLPPTHPDAPVMVQWLVAVSRFCWAANSLWSLAAVVGSFHLLWCIYATPSWARRRFIFDNSKTVSIVYGVGSPTFLMLIVGTFTGTIGNIMSYEHYMKKDWISAVAGLSVGFLMCNVFIMCSGKLIAKVVRPWKLADENLKVGKRRWSKTTGRSIRGYLDTVRSRDDNINGIGLYCEAEHAGFGELAVGMPFVAQKLCNAGFTLEKLQRVGNELLMDQLLQTCINNASDRLEVIFFVRDASSFLGDDEIRARSIATGTLPENPGLDGNFGDSYSSE